MLSMTQMEVGLKDLSTMEAFMRKACLVVFCLFLLPLAAMAQQDFPKAEVFAGYSYFRANPDGLNLNGWNGSVTGNLTNWLGVEGDFSGHYGSPKLFGFNVPFVDINSYTFMGGPRLSYRSGSITPFAHFLIGAARAGTSSFGVSVSDTALAAAMGGGVDINLNRSIAVRAIQVDYLVTRFKTTSSQVVFSGFDERQNNFRVSAGIVFKF
jgi:opacity protein-like surface antigen